MLNKILSNLRFNPDYFQLLKEYQAKQSHEKLIRGIGFSFIVLAFVIQIIAYTPASSQSSASASDNDLIPGGVSSQAQIANDCYSNYHFTQLIYGTYGISCAEIASPTSPVVTLNSTDYNDQLWSVGHLPYGIAGETPVTIYGGGTLYWRLLHGWDTNGSSNYKALRVTSADNKAYWILFQCGNLVSLGFPSPYVAPTVAPTPAPTPAPLPTPAPAPAPTPTPAPAPAPAPCQYNSAIYASSPACKPCTNSQDTTDVVSCLTYSKAAENITQGVANANNVTADPGDNIKYTLTVANTGKAEVKDYVVQDNISDVLDYSNVSTIANGGSVSSNNIISWPAVNIEPKNSVSETFNILVKNPLPQIAPNQDDPQGYNNIMTNVYGNTINIPVKQTAVVAVAAAATTSLPNTGPGSSIFVMFIVVTIAGYFYSRSRLLSKEAKIAELIPVEGAAV